MMKPSLQTVLAATAITVIGIPLAMATIIAASIISL
ncbi:putative protein OS=Afipia felis OX=1035 GN=BN961_01252 PE=4 SV=1 [Afipia felis]